MPQCYHKIAWNIRFNTLNFLSDQATDKKKMRDYHEHEHICIFALWFKRWFTKRMLPKGEFVTFYNIKHKFEFSVKYFLFYYFNSFIAELCHKIWLIAIVNWNWIRTFFVLHFIISINTRISPIECRTFFSLESYWVAIQIQPFTEKNTCVTEKNSGKWAQICSAERVSMKVLTK